MTDVDTSVCQNCEHQFKTKAGELPEYFNPERTQAITLPPNFKYSRDEDGSSLPNDLPTFIEPAAARRQMAAPFVAIIAIIALLVTALLWCLLR